MWLAELSKIDVVHANAGSHDLAFGIARDNYQYVSLEQYAINLKWIIDTFRSSGIDSIIWGLNTPVHEPWHNSPRSNGKLRSIGRLNEDIELYNQVAVKVMEGLSVKVNDLYAPIVEASTQDCLLDDGVHLSGRGSEIISEIVAQSIRDIVTLK